MNQKSPQHSDLPGPELAVIQGWLSSQTTASALAWARATNVSDTDALKKAIGILINSKRAAYPTVAILGYRVRKEIKRKAGESAVATFHKEVLGMKPRVASDTCRVGKMLCAMIDVESENIFRFGPCQLRYLSRLGDLARPIINDRAHEYDLEDLKCLKKAVQDKSLPASFDDQSQALLAVKTFLRTSGDQSDDSEPKAKKGKKGSSASKQKDCAPPTLDELAKVTNSIAVLIKFGRSAKGSKKPIKRSDAISFCEFADSLIRQAKQITELFNDAAA